MSSLKMIYKYAFVSNEVSDKFSQTALIFYAEYKDRMHKSTMQSESFANPNANIRLQMFNRANARITFQKFLWCVTGLAYLTIANNELL